MKNRNRDAERIDLVSPKPGAWSPEPGARSLESDG